MLLGFNSDSSLGLNELSVSYCVVVISEYFISVICSDTGTIQGESEVRLLAQGSIEQVWQHAG